MAGSSKGWPIQLLHSYYTAARPGLYSYYTATTQQQGLAYTATTQLPHSYYTAARAGLYSYNTATPQLLRAPWVLLNVGPCLWPSSACRLVSRRPKPETINHKTLSVAVVCMQARVEALETEKQSLEENVSKTRTLMRAMQVCVWGG